jgi:hypothetical protein
MTINEEKKNAKFSIPSDNSDYKLVIVLISEYNEKLIKLCEKIEDNKKKYSLSRFFLLCLFLLLSLLFISLIRWNNVLFKNNIFFDVLVLFIIPIYILFILYSYIFSNNATKKIGILQRQAKSTSLKLERIIRTASQLQDHVDPQCLIILELDFRLADAESALEYYQEIVGK